MCGHILKMSPIKPVGLLKENDTAQHAGVMTTLSCMVVDLF